MTSRHEHDLLGYLTGALEPDERRAVEDALRQDALLNDALPQGGPLRGELHNELRRVRRQLALLKRNRLDSDELAEFDFDLEPPPGLADRTLQFIAQFGHSNGEHSDAGRHQEPEFAELAPAELEPSSKRKWRGVASREPLAVASNPWRFVDVVVALSVCLAGAGLVFPLLNANRSNARITVCANNLRDVGVALTEYSEHQNGFFPRVAETGKLAAGGIYAPTLLAGKYISDPRSFICPGSQLADVASLRIPTVDEIQAASGKELAELHRQMGGSYGYALGYRQGGVYRPTRNLYRESFALVADEPSEDCASSPNHAGRGQNVLLEDGHVVFLKSCRLDGSTDDIFTNDDGRVAAGCHINDAVVVRSDVSP